MIVYLLRHPVIASTLALMLSSGVDGSGVSVVPAPDENRPVQEHTNESQRAPEAAPLESMNPAIETTGWAVPLVRTPEPSPSPGLHMNTESPSRAGGTISGAWWGAQPRDVALVERVNQPFRSDFTATFNLLGGGITATSAWQVSVNGGSTWADVADTSRPFSVGGSNVAISLVLPDIWWPMNGNMYRAVVRVSEGSVFYSDAATLTVLPGQVAINANPQGQTVTEGGTAVFSARHGGASAPAEVRWQRSDDQSAWTDIEGTRAPIEFNTESRYELEAPFALDGTFYRAVFSNARTEAATNPARLTVSPLLPVVSQSPVSRSVSEGGSATFTSRYTGTAAPTSATWEHSVDGGASWADVPDAAADPTLTFERVTLDMDGRQYRVRYSNASGSVWSEAATLTVRPVRPVVTEHPVSVGVAPGDAAEFSAAFGGTDAETTVQWQFSTDGGATFSYVPAGVGPNGAQSIPLIVDPVTPEMDGWLYRARFTNAAGSAWSDAARLTVAAVWPDVVGQAVAGGEVEVQIHSIDEPRTGVMEVTAPEGTRITSARSNGVNITFLISEDGRTAVSSRLVNPWGGAFPSAWVTLQVDPDAPAGAILDGGQARAMSSAGVPNMVMSIAVEVIAAPEITQHPQAVSVVEGQGAVLSAAATGHPAPAVQWQASTDAGASWADIDGATGAEFTIDDARLAMDGTLYRAVFTNSAGTAVTESARLSVREVRYLNLSVRPIVRLVDTL